MICFVFLLSKLLYGCSFVSCYLSGNILESNALENRANSNFTLKPCGDRLRTQCRDTIEGIHFHIDIAFTEPFFGYVICRMLARSLQTIQHLKCVFSVDLKVQSFLVRFKMQQLRNIVQDGEHGRIRLVQRTELMHSSIGREMRAARPLRFFRNVPKRLRCKLNIPQVHL